MSKIQKIGELLYGETWQTQLARDLKNDDGVSLARQTIQKYHKENLYPFWVANQIEELIIIRKNDIQKALDLNKLYSNQRISSITSKSPSEAALRRAALEWHRALPDCSNTRPQAEALLEKYTK